MADEKTGAHMQKAQDSVPDFLRNVGLYSISAFPHCVSVCIFSAARRRAEKASAPTGFGEKQEKHHAGIKMSTQCSLNTQGKYTVAE